MNYKDYHMVKKGQCCSVGTFGDKIFAYEYLTGFTDTPAYIQITQEEFNNFTGENDYGERKILCSGYIGQSEIDDSIVLDDKEIEKKKKDKTLWRAGVYSEELFNGQGIVVFDFIPYKLTRRAYQDIPHDTSLLNGFKTIRIGYLWQLAYEEVFKNEYPRGTYCKTVQCIACGSEFYLNEMDQQEIQCPDCKRLIII